MPAIAALFVATGGVYFGLPDIDPWDKARDARVYTGPLPVVAHPPCERWGRYWYGGPSALERKRRGEDGGCFVSALASVRRWGGVIEHPEGSAAWRTFGLLEPPKGGGWLQAGDRFPSWTCCVEQGHYGHRARKATWLYVCGRKDPPPALQWGPSAATAKIDLECHSAEERRRMQRPPAGTTPEQRAARRAWLEAHERATGKAWCCPELLNKRERAATPPAFRDLLIEIARGCAPSPWSAPPCPS